MFAWLDRRSDRFEPAESHGVFATGLGGQLTEQRIVPLRALYLQCRNSDDGLLGQENLIRERSDRQLHLVSPGLPGDILPDVNTRLGWISKRREFERCRSSPGLDEFCYSFVLNQRLELCVFEDRTDHDLLSDNGLLFVDQQHSTIGIPQQSTLACPPHQFGVIGIKVLFADFSHSPELSTTLEDHSAAAIKLGG